MHILAPAPCLHTRSRYPNPGMKEHALHRRILHCIVMVCLSREGKFKRFTQQLNFYFPSPLGTAAFCRSKCFGAGGCHGTKTLAPRALFCSAATRGDSARPFRRFDLLLPPLPFCLPFIGGRRFATTTQCCCCCRCYCRFFLRFPCLLSHFSSSQVCALTAPLACKRLLTRAGWSSNSQDQAFHSLLVPFLFCLLSLVSTGGLS